ncbi:MAG: hypothetical protein GF310_12120, partial [candidate division Zixibacteria bacterium]|nr:hypothetical protein [candidate division Zixibacteria bacterium]
MSEYGPEYTHIDCASDGPDSHSAFLFMNSEDSLSVVEGFSIRNAIAPGIGGGILCDGASPSILNCVFTNNRSYAFGGGISCDNGSKAKIIDCRFEDNTADMKGGAIYSRNSDPYIEGCFFRNNRSIEGGALYSSRSNFSMMSCTFFENDAPVGSAVYSYHYTVQISNSIIAFNKNGNAVEGAVDLSCTDVFGNESGDWIGDIAGEDSLNNNLHVDPMFCDTASGEFGISSISECGPYVNTECGLIGALPVSCYSDLPVALQINFGPEAHADTVLHPTPSIYWTYFDTVASTQQFYEIQVSSDNDWGVAEMWSSGQVASVDTQAVYSGMELEDNSTYYLRIRLSNGASTGAWSYSSFTTHLKNTLYVPSVFSTIQDAIDAALNGDTILVADGTYSGDGNRNLNFLGKKIIVVSQNGPENAIIDCQGSQADPYRAFLFDSGEDSTSILEGFTIQNGWTTGSGGAIRCMNTSPIIRNCRFTNNHCAIHGGAIHYYESSGVVLESCVFEENTSSGWGGAVDFHEAGARIEFCTFIKDSANYGGGIHMHQSSADINNCTFVNNAAAEYGAGIHSYGSNPYVSSCLIAYSTDGEAVRGDASMTCCNIYDNAGGDWVDDIIGQYGQNGNISEKPLFCNLAGGDFSIFTTSPCSPMINEECGLIGSIDVGCYGDLPIALDINYGPQAQGDTIFDETPDIFWSYYDTVSSTQDAYEIEVGTDENWSMAEMWSSGEIISTDTHSVYAGNPLQEAENYFLRIRLKKDGNWGMWMESHFYTHIDNVIHVPLDQPTIQAGIDEAWDGDTVLVADGVYTGEGNRDLLLINKSIVLKSENGPDNTIIDCQGTQQNLHRGITIGSVEDTTTVFDGFTIKNAYTTVGAGINCFSASCLITNCILRDNYAHVRGGGISIDGDAFPFIRDCIFQSNSAQETGGGGYFIRGWPTLDNCIFSENSSENGGGAYLLAASPTIKSCTFVGNDAFFGSGIYSETFNSSIENTIIAFNTTGEGLWGEPELSCCNIYGNQGGNWIGPILDQYGQNGNISVDPQFCDLENGDYSISSLSSCSPLVNVECGLIGAMGIGCHGELPIAVNIGYEPVINDSVISSPDPIIYWSYFDTLSTEQEAYEIEVGSDDDWSSAEMWSSGIIVSSDTSAQYAGAALSDGSKYFMRIRVRKSDGWGSWTHSVFLTHFVSVINVPSFKPTIQDAINTAVDGDTILVASGVYTGEGNRDLNFLGKKIVVISESGPDETIIDCQGSQYDRHRGFTFDSGEDFTSELTGFMIINGYGPYSHERYEGGAIMCDSSSPLIKECIFANNTGDYQGGAVSIFKSHPKFVNCTFYGNSAAYGGGIYSRYSDPRLENCIIAFSESGTAVHGLAYLECCNLYGNAGGDWV